MRENFATVLETVADVRADRTAVTHGDRSLTWRQLDERASRLAAFLAGRAVGAETPVAIALYNGIEYLESVFAVLKLRAIPVNLNYRYQSREMLHVLDDAQAAAFIFDASLGARVAEARAGVRTLRTLVQVGGAPAAPVSSYEQVIAKTAKTFRRFDGKRWVVTGDLASLEADGSITFRGRDSRVINTGGEKVFAEEVDQVLIEHPGVCDALVVGLPDQRWGQRVTAVVARVSDEGPAADALIAHVAERLADYKKPCGIVFVPDVQRSPSGKADLQWAQAVPRSATRPYELDTSPVPTSEGGQMSEST